MDYFKLGAVLTLKDMLSEKMDGIKGKLNDFRNQLKGRADDLAMFEASMKSLKIGGAVLGSGLVLASGLIAARMESSKLEANIRSLGITAQETDKISQSTRVMASEYGIAKETFLTGIYDIKSAVSSLDPGQLAGISEQIAKLALATKGDFAGLSDLFGVAHAQFKKMYKGLNDENFAALFANTISYSANVYKTDGAKMQQAMQSLGASAASLGIPLEEQSVVLGRLQNTMQAGVAGTSYRAFLVNIAEGFGKLGLRAVDANGKLSDMPKLLAQLRARFGDTLDLTELDKIKKAFGSEEAVGFIKEMLPAYKELGSEIKTIQDLNKAGNMKFVNEASKENLLNLSQQVARVGAGWKAFKDLIAKGFGDSFIAPLAGKIADLFVWIQKAAQQSPALASLLSNLGGLAVAVSVVGGTVMAYGAAMRIYNLLMYQNALASGLAGSASKAYAIGVQLLGNGFSFAAIKAGVLKIAQIGLNAVMSINPIFALITGIMALIVYWDDLKAHLIDSEKVAKSAGFSIWGAYEPLINLIKKIVDNWEIIKSVFGFKITAGDQLAMDLKKANTQLEELKKKQDILEKAGQTKLPEYQKLTQQIKLQSDAVEKLKGQEDARGKVSSGLDEIKQRIDALKAAQPMASAASKAAMENQISALTDLQGKIQDALDVGKVDLAEKLGSKSELNKIEEKGMALAKTFAEGIRKGKVFTDVEIKDLAASITRFLPSSDAKEGPLSNLKARGKALVNTFNQGVEIQGRDTDATEKFVQRQAQTIKTDSPLMEKLTGGAGGRISAGSIFGNIYLTLAGRGLSREEFARQLADQFLDILDKAEPA